MINIAAAVLFSIFIPFKANAAEPSAFRLDGVRIGDIEEISPAPAVIAGLPEAAEPAQWTVMLYSTTRDQLRKALAWQLLEMKRTGSTGKVRVVAQATMPFQRADGSVSTDTVRLALNAPGSDADIDAAIEAMFKGPAAIDEKTLDVFAGDIVWRRPAGDTGDWRAVTDFTRWAKTNYPARRYAFVIYGHGNGIFDAKKKQEKGTLVDTETGNYVTLPELRDIMRDTGHVDAFIMTSCIMQMAEVAWQVKDYTDVVVGSSELMFAIGYDTGGLLTLLNAKPESTPEYIGTFLASRYVERAKSFNLPGAHASVLRTARLTELGRKIDAWVEAETAFDNRKAELAGIQGAARFDIFGVTMATTTPGIAAKLSISGDLYDFVRITAENTPQDKPEGALAVQRAGELREFISTGLLHGYYSYGVSPSGFDYSRAHGLSVHIPPVKIIGGSWPEFAKILETDYWTLPFAKETRWGSFLKGFYKLN
jgi:hypothetical protein